MKGENESDDEIDDNNEESQPMEFDGLECKNRHNELIDEIFQNLTQKECEKYQINNEIWKNLIVKNLLQHLILNKLDNNTDNTDEYFKYMGESF